MSKANNVLSYYETVLKGWQVKALGPKPTLANFEAAHALGCRAGKQALAMAMYLRDSGATDGQVKMACIIQWGSSGSHHNKRRDIISAGWVKAKPVQADAQGHKVYAIALTDKGTKKLATPVAAEKAAPVKAKGERKDKPKPAPKVQPVAELAAVTEPLPGVAAEVQQPAAQ